ncbi:MAG: phosphoglucosamine mutase [Acidobacteria bacterium]|nr:MAG: phosphoglucosamine mutase [Acidobacteriota bacterium]
MAVRPAGSGSGAQGAALSCRRNPLRADPGGRSRRRRRRGGTPGTGAGADRSRPPGGGPAGEGRDRGDSPALGDDRARAGAGREEVTAQGPTGRNGEREAGLRKLFGTDGIRGTAGSPPLDRSTIYRLGRALAASLREEGRPARVCLGQDTRESSDWIAAELARGVRDGGGEAVSAGVLPTPGLALVTRSCGFDAGLMISASHNPYRDNGVKVFDAAGSKLPDEKEAWLEKLMEGMPEPPSAAAEDVPVEPGLRERYLRHLDACRGSVSFEGLTVVLDTANGAATAVAPEAFRRAGAEVVTLADAPDGRNINAGCGSLHPEAMAQAVTSNSAAIGFAFDGDADRCIAASASGAVLDGDFTLFYAGCALRERGALPHDTVVATVMSNLGLELALQQEGISLRRTAVGDRYVLEEMRRGGYALGGEQSGHVIFMEHAPTGDGIQTAILLCRLWLSGAEDPEIARSRLPRFPQVLRSVPVAEKPEIEGHPVIGPAVAAAERELGREGRVLVRYSGTEPKARVMVEGKDQRQVTRIADDLAELFRTTLGSGGG